MHNNEHRSLRFVDDHPLQSHCLLAEILAVGPSEEVKLIQNACRGHATGPLVHHRRFRQSTGLKLLTGRVSNPEAK